MGMTPPSPQDVARALWLLLALCPGSWALDRSARFHSTNLARTGCFQHHSPCPSSLCTQTFERMELFGVVGTGEIIAKGYPSPREAHEGWMGSAGHCAIILGESLRAGTGRFEDHWTDNFSSGTAATGTVTNGTWLATVPLKGPACHRYAFHVEDASGAPSVLPGLGSYGVGAGPDCPDWDPATTAPCSTPPARTGCSAGGPGLAALALAAWAAAFRRRRTGAIGPHPTRSPP